MEEKKFIIRSKGGKEREIIFKKGSGNNSTNYCKNNCSLYGKCKKIKSPIDCNKPEEDNFFDFCSNFYQGMREVVVNGVFPIDFSSYVPDSTSLIKNFPEIFEVEDLNEEEK